MSDPTIRLNQYARLTDSRHTCYDVTWSQFVQWILTTHVETQNKEAQELFNLTTFSGDRALQADAVGTQAVILDFDHITASQLAEVYGRLIQYETLWYTTHSYSTADRRVRCILLLDRPATFEEFKATWKHIAELCQVLDTKCKNLDRRYFVPSHAPGADHWAEYSPGQPYPVATVAPLVQTKQTKEQQPLRDILDGEILAVVKKEAKQGKDVACVLKERAMLGLPLADPGDRDNTLWRLACWFVNHWPDGRPSALLDMCSGSISLMNDPTFTIDTLAEKIERSRAALLERAETEIDLLRNSQGTPVPGAENMHRILTRDPALQGRMRLNTFSSRVECHGLPWDQEVEGELRDSDLTKLQCYCESKYRLFVKRNQAAESAYAAASFSKYNSVQDYLSGLKWDGKPRLDTWLSDYAGADANPITSKMGVRWVISAVARAMTDRETKVDYVLILHGPQGFYKSAVLKALLGGPDGTWFSDQLSSLDNKDSSQDLPGKWCIEWAELSTFKRANSDSVKSFVTRTVDHYRPSHGRVAIDVPRHCVFCATTNEEEFLHDPTGNRRFWVVESKRICDVKGMLESRDQLLAEALVRFRAGEQWWPARGETEAIAEMTEQYRVADSWEEKIRTWFASTPSTTPVDQMSSLWFLETVVGMSADKCNRASEMRIAAVLKKLGFERRFGGPNKDLKRWYPPPGLERGRVPALVAVK